MTIQVGERLPDVPLAIAGAEGPQPTTSGEYFKGKKVALFAVPGAFTPTCSARHLPSYVDKAGELKAKGIDAPPEESPEEDEAEALAAFESATTERF